MEQSQLGWAGAAAAALLAAVAVGVSTQLPEPRIPPPEPFQVAADLTAETPRTRRPEVKPVRPVPAAPRPAPEGAPVLQGSGLSIWDIAPGSGQPARDGQVVVIDYVGWLDDGTSFDASYRRADPFRFVLGGGRVVPGLDEGVRGMRVGGQRQLVVPGDLGFGDRGIPMRVPPGASLTYELELLDILELPLEMPAGAGTARPSGLQVLDVAEGTGPAVEAGDKVVMDYVLWLADGTRLETSLERPAATMVVAGDGKLFPGWDEGLLGMKQGGHRKLVIPPELAFGSAGKPPSVPPDATLVVELWVRRVD